MKERFREKLVVMENIHESQIKQVHILAFIFIFSCLIYIQFFKFSIVIWLIASISYLFLIRFIEIVARKNYELEEQAEKYEKRLLEIESEKESNETKREQTFGFDENLV